MTLELKPRGGLRGCRIYWTTIKGHQPMSLLFIVLSLPILCVNYYLLGPWVTILQPCLDMKVNWYTHSKFRLLTLPGQCTVDSWLKVSRFIKGSLVCKTSVLRTFNSCSTTTHHTPLIIRHSSHTSHHTPLITHHSSYTTHHTPLIIHYSSYTTHHTPLITHH